LKQVVVFLTNRRVLCYALVFVAFSTSVVAQNVATEPGASSSPPNIVFPRERIENLGKLKQEIKSYYECTCTCGCYSAEIEEQADRSIQFLRSRSQHTKPGERLAVIFDIDETALSNYPYLLRSDFTIEPVSWNQWVESVQATAIPGTLRVYNEAKTLHLSIFFITGRRDSQRQATEKNLHARGYTDWDGLTLRSPEEAKLPAAEYKPHARQKIVDRGFHIILNIGDQISDLAGYPQAELSVKLPDPFYYIP